MHSGHSVGGCQLPEQSALTPKRGGYSSSSSFRGREVQGFDLPGFDLPRKYEACWTCVRVSATETSNGRIAFCTACLLP